MPMTNQDTISDTAFGHRIPHVWASVINSVKFIFVFENSQVCAVDVERLAFQVLKRIGGDRVDGSQDRLDPLSL